ncbi:hypothetical protein QTL95_21410 [Rhizobium sp. S152]|uniref:hypothetical protein n=1 Tax=Rhizobium sp. S152 TaxID=3055038 RepID=UPI0025A99045|nr:hypothetical protein [Rhizobium sp. S152]MDM9628458.1 hypothetical protein [Rhizobium sp. S152]
MSRTEDPSPRTGIKPERKGFAWNSENTIDYAQRSTLSLDDGLLKASMDGRRSIRSQGPISVADAAVVLRETFRTTFFGAGDLEGRRRKRLVSAGAIHPVKCLIVTGAGEIIFYNDEDDCFESIAPTAPSEVRSFLSECLEVIPGVNGCFLVLLADTRDSQALYSNYQSLLWRDAGAALQTMALISTTLGLAFCPLGILGQGLVDALLPSGHTAIGVGVAALGSMAP